MKWSDKNAIPIFSFWKITNNKRITDAHTKKQFNRNGKHDNQRWTFERKGFGGSQASSCRYIGILVTQVCYGYSFASKRLQNDFVVFPSICLLSQVSHIWWWVGWMDTAGWWKNDEQNIETRVGNSNISINCQLLGSKQTVLCGQ